MSRITNFEKFKNKLVETGVEIIANATNLMIPIRKHDWMYPDLFVIFNYNGYTFAMYKSKNTTNVKVAGWIYITAVKQTPNELIYREIGLLSLELPKINENTYVKNYGSYLVSNVEDIDIFLNLVD